MKITRVVGIALMMCWQVGAMAQVMPPKTLARPTIADLKEWLEDEPDSVEIVVRSSDDLEIAIGRFMKRAKLSRFAPVSLPSLDGVMFFGTVPKGSDPMVVVFRWRPGSAFVRRLVSIEAMTRISGRWINLANLDLDSLPADRKAKVEGALEITRSFARSFLLRLEEMIEAGRLE